VNATGELSGDETAVALEPGADGQLEVELAHAVPFAPAGKSPASVSSSLGQNRKPRTYAVAARTAAMRWEELFERAAEYEVTVADVTDATESLRADE
jgi:hypothetical protein